MSKRAYHIRAHIFALLLCTFSATCGAGAAQFNVDLAGAYTSNLEREADGESGFFALSRIEGMVPLPQLLQLPAHIGLILEDKRYEGGDSAQWSELYIGSTLYRHSVIELRCDATGTYVRDKLVPEDDFYAAALGTGAKLRLTPGIDLSMAYNVQWRNYADKVQSPRSGMVKTEPPHMDIHTPADSTRLETRHECTQRTSLGLSWMPRAELRIVTSGSYSDNSASVAMERWYAWAGETGLTWQAARDCDIQLWGGISRQQYPETRKRRVDTLRHAGTRASYYIQRWEFYLGLEWERNSSNIATETYSARTLTCGTRFHF